MQGMKECIHHCCDVGRGGIPLNNCYIPGNGPEFAVSKFEGVAAGCCIPFRADEPNGIRAFGHARHNAPSLAERLFDRVLSHAGSENSSVYVYKRGLLPGRSTTRAATE
jgi:hypothetical protein